MNHLTRTVSVLFVLLSMFSPLSYAAEYAQKTDISPMRLSYAEGKVSFWRYGAQDWVQAQINTPVTTGDALYVGSEGNLEVDMGWRAYVRADDDTQLSLVNLAPDFSQFKITSGRVSFDLRSLPVGYSVEVDTPNAVFTIDRVGYYRVDVDDDVHFITRRGGRATMVPAGGQPMSVHPAEEIVVEGSDNAQASTYAAPALDRWDRWNYDRTDDLLDAVSERYLPYGVAGAADLDQYGTWRVVPEYGTVWVPDSVSPGWAPYSDGSWIWDPYYQWTWVDAAPWGWAPFHYGRWVYLGGYWAWAPGPVVRRAVYAPALVAFFNVGPNVTVSISSGGIGWVALSWGEPLVPWWGQPGFAGRPWWGGWGGPHVVNNVVVQNTTVVNVTNITYNNTHVDNAVVATSHDHFGNGHSQHEELVHISRPQRLEHFHGALPVQPGPASLMAGPHEGSRPPENLISRPVVAIRPPHEARLPWRSESSRPSEPEGQRYRLVPQRTFSETQRPQYGSQTGAELPRPAQPPRFIQRRRETSGDNAMQPSAPPEAFTNQRQRTEPALPTQRQEPARAAPRPAFPGFPAAQPRQQERAADLPGKPANRVFRDRGDSTDSNNGENDKRRSRPRKEDGWPQRQ